MECEAQTKAIILSANVRIFSLLYSVEEEECGRNHNPIFEDIDHGRETT